MHIRRSNSTRNWACPIAWTIVACALATARGEDWPSFRGPTGQGISSEKGLPTRWSATENIVWKTALPGQGWSSPIVSKGRVFVTTASESGACCRLICLDRADGKILWDKEVYRQKPLRKETRNSYATSTPAADGKRIYALFADGAILAVDYEGRVEWSNREVHFYGQHGLGTSPLLYGDLLVVSFDGSSETGDKTVGWQKPWDKGFVLALERDSGKERWRGQRGQSRIAHTTPTILKVQGGDQLVSNAGDVIQGFDPLSGRRMWSVRSEGEGVVPSPVCGAGLVFTTSGFGKPAIRAVRPGNGANREAQMVWQEKRAVPMISSMLYAKPYLFTIAQDGFASCLIAATGATVWRERVSGNYSASPIWANGKLYLLADNGDTIILEAGSTFRVLDRNPIGEHCQASLAASDGQLFLRTEKQLFCIGAKKARR